MPTPSAASRIAGSTPVMPATVFRRIGSIEYSVSASSEGRNPSAENPCPNADLLSADSASSSG